MGKYNIESENGYLKGKYAHSFLAKKSEIRMLNDERQLKSSIFISIGSTVALSQIAEFVLFNITTIKKIIDSNPPEEQIKQAIDETMKSFNIDKIEIETIPGLGNVINNLKQAQLITEDEFEKVKFIYNNRNNFTHNYFMRYPKALKGIGEMKLLIAQSFYTVLSLNQLINDVFIRFRDETLANHPIMEKFLIDFNEMFIGEFKG